MFRRSILLGGAVLGMAPALAQSNRVGTYEGTWGGANPGDEAVLTAVLVIASVAPDGTTRGKFTWSDSPESNMRAGSFDFQRGRMEENMLTLGMKETFVFTFGNDRSITATRSIDGKVVSKASMTKTSDKVN